MLEAKQELLAEGGDRPGRRGRSRPRSASVNEPCDAPRNGPDRRQQMAFNLHNRSFLTLLDFTPREIRFLLDLSRDLKRAKYGGYEQQHMRGKNIAIIFEKASTRTRVSFEVAAYDQGAHVTYLGPSGSRDRPQGVDERHGTGAGAHLPRHRVPRLRPGDRGAARPVRRTSPRNYCILALASSAPSSSAVEFRRTVHQRRTYRAAASCPTLRWTATGITCRRTMAMRTVQIGARRWSRLRTYPPCPILTRRSPRTSRQTRAPPIPRSPERKELHFHRATCCQVPRLTHRLRHSAAMFSSLAMRLSPAPTT